mgnify:CR=1 FL=1
MSQAPRDEQDRARACRARICSRSSAEHFVTDTAAYADIILPATMAGEHDDMMFSWGHFYLTHQREGRSSRAASAKSNARDLPPARRRAWASTITLFKMTDMRACRALHQLGRRRRWAASTWSYFTQARLFPARRRHARRPRCRTRDGKFPTPSGKVEFCVERRQELRRTAVPA